MRAKGVVRIALNEVGLFCLPEVLSKCSPTDICCDMRLFSEDFLHQSPYLANWKSTVHM